MLTEPKPLISVSSTVLPVEESAPGDEDESEGLGKDYSEPGIIK